MQLVSCVGMGDKGQEGGESQVEIWKIKRVSRLWLKSYAGGHRGCSAVRILQLIKALEEARGNGTSMISLIMPPKDQVTQAHRQSIANTEPKPQNNGQQTDKHRMYGTGCASAENAW